MTPNQIKAALRLVDVSQADIARVCNVSRGHVYRVVEGQTVSHPVQKVIAAAIGKEPEQVFPDRYSRKPSASKQESLERASAALAANG